VILPGFPMLMAAGGVAPTTPITLTAGWNSATFYGFISGSFGSISAEPIPGVTLRRFYDGAGNRNIDFGTVDVVAQLTPYTRVEVNGTSYAVTWELSGTVSRAVPVAGSFGFVNGGTYTIQFFGD
jgi:hypothetical protein